MKLKSLYIILLLSLSNFSLQAQVDVESLNTAWEFTFCNQDGAFDVNNLSQINIPHTWNTDAYHQKDYRRTYAHYQKEFFVAKADQEKTLYLKFEGVNSLARVFVNGEMVKEHAGGYTAFTINVDEYVRYEQLNKLEVFVSNTNENIPPLSGDFTIFGGIYRDVWLIRKNKIHFAQDNYGSEGVFVETKIDSKEFADLTARVNLASLENTQKLSLHATLKDAEGNLIAETSKKISVKGSVEEQINLPRIESPNLWSPDAPYLYQLEIQLKDKSRKLVYDSFSKQVGFRWFSLNTNRQFLLNGEPLKLIGACRHQDMAPYGIALSDEAHRRDVRLVKELGANFLRIAHYPQDPAVLKECDRLGILVWEEIPVVDIIADIDIFKENCKTALKEMIRQHYNHPSVVMWGYMNEAIIQVQYRIKDQEKKKSLYKATTALAHELEELQKSEDPNRLSVMAYHGTQLYHEIGLSSVTDISGWNLYQGWYGGGLENFEKYLENEHKNHPERPLLISEFGAGSDKRLHTENPGRLDFSMEWQQLFLEHYLPVIQNTPYVMGGTMWNMIDFSSASRQESMPRINNKGLLYSDRSPKDVFFYYQSFLRKDKPIIHLAVRDWTKRTLVADKGQTYTQSIKVYTNLSNISLYHNGQKLSSKEVENRHAIWEVPLVEGENHFKTVGQWDGKAVEDFAVVDVDFMTKQPLVTSAQNIEIAINAGSNCSFTDEESHFTWVSDRPYQEGSWGYVNGEVFRRGEIAGTTAEVHGTDNEPLLQTKRKGDVQYRFDLPNGEYELELLFADIYAHRAKLAYELGQSEESAKGISVFDININGETIFKNFTPIKIAGSHFALRKKVTIKVNNNKLELSLASKDGEAFINALKLRKL